jgi:serine/threonine protein kinase
MEIEQRHLAGASPDPDEFALRFPQWADELRVLATQCLEELEQARIESSETLEENSGSRFTIETRKAELQRQWSDQWQSGSAAARSFGLPADGVLGHYHLQSVIGRGGMGLVVRARDTRLDRDVAIKVLATTVSGDTATHERFLREARAAAAVRHTNVVTVYAVEIISDIPFLVMELVDGVTLEKYLQQSGKLETAEVISLAVQIAEGLAWAHRQGLIHRDVKPANILLERNTSDKGGAQPVSPWHVRIADFGLARIAADRKLTNSGLIAGTPQYMSPEQANGKEIDVRSDLFSLGSVMYAMCAGEDAFHGEDDDDEMNEFDDDFEDGFDEEDLSGYEEYDY